MAVISHWLPPYYLWWKLVAFFEEDQHRLCQLMVLNGFLSNPEIPGTEKLCVSVADPSWLASPKKDLEAAECGMPDDGIAPPESFFFVKGWPRSVCCLAVLWFSFKSEEFCQARNLIFTASWDHEIPPVSSLPTTQDVCLYQIGAFVGRFSQKMSRSLFAKHRFVDVNSLGYNMFFSNHIIVHPQIPKPTSSGHFRLSLQPWWLLTHPSW